MSCSGSIMSRHGRRRRLTHACAQGHFPPRSCRTLEADPRFRSHPAFPAPHRDHPLHALAPRQLALVGSPVRQCGPDDLRGHVGLSVAGTSTHQFRWNIREGQQQQHLCVSGRRGELLSRPEPGRWGRV